MNTTTDHGCSTQPTAQPAEFSANGNALAEYYSELLVNFRVHNSSTAKNTLRQALSTLYGGNATEPLMFLLQHADESLFPRFVNFYMCSDLLARCATVRIIVRQNNDETLVHGNTGYYLLYAQLGHHTPLRIKFTNKISLIFYLAHLIQRKQLAEAEQLPAFNLQKMQFPFIRLFCHCYDINPCQARDRTRQLLYRQDGDHKRAGRKNEIIFDINRHLEDLFMQFGESALPYSITSRSHLAVPARNIVFEGDAQTLLKDFSFVHNQQHPFSAV